MPLSFRKEVSGETPIASRTISLCSFVPLANCTCICSPTSANPWTISEKIRLTPCSSSSFAKIEDISVSNGANICGPASIKETSRPASLRFSAISTPMNPPPITTAERVPSAATLVLILSVSGMLRSMWILELSIPGKFGRIGLAPGDKISAS
ncbi:hypothetical protein D3C76_495170 [compost metagenome]